MNQPRMWRSIFETQWKWSRMVLLLGAVIMFAIPILSLRTASNVRGEAAFVAVMQAWSVGYALAAAGLGLLIGLSAWSHDHRLRHVYALSLPISRSRYVLMRFTSGLALLLAPIAALLIGAEIVAHSALVPQALHAYPIALTVRFALALLVAYALFFAISSATARTAGYMLGTLGLLIVAQVVASALGFPGAIIGRVTDVIFATPGLLAVFSGRWMLIDV